MARTTAKPVGNEAATDIFLPEDLPPDGRVPDPQLALAYGFEVNRERESVVKHRTIVWTERLLVIRSHSYTQAGLADLQRRLDQAEAALRNLTPVRARGKQPVTDEPSVVAAIAKIEQHYRVQGLFQCPYTSQVKERHVRAYKDKPARLERQVRYQLTVQRDQAAIAATEFKIGWRIYATNAPTETFSLTSTALLGA